MTTTLEWNARAVGWLRNAVDGCNLNHVPQSIKRIIKSGAWRERYETGFVFKFEKFSDFITKPLVEGGCGWKPELVEGLLLKAEDPEALAMWRQAMAAQEAQQADEKDRANERPVGTNQYSEGVDNKKDDVNTLRPDGNSEKYALRRLRHAAKDDDRIAAIYRRVLDGELSAHAAMVTAGFRKKPQRQKLTPVERISRMIEKYLPELSDEDRAELRGLLD